MPCCCKSSTLTGHKFLRREPLPTGNAQHGHCERVLTLREKIRFFCRFAPLIVDEIGDLPVIPGGGSLFLQLVNARYEKGAIILTSNADFRILRLKTGLWRSCGRDRFA